MISLSSRVSVDACERMRGRKRGGRSVVIQERCIVALREDVEGGGARESEGNATLCHPGDTAGCRAESENSPAAWRRGTRSA